MAIQTGDRRSVAGDASLARTTITGRALLSIVCSTVVAAAAGSQVMGGGCSAPAVRAVQAREVVVRRVGTVGRYAGLHGSSVSRDGRYLVYTDWTTGDLAIRDLVSGADRRVTDKGPLRKVVEFAESFMQFSGDGKQLAYIWDRNGYELHGSNVDGSDSRVIYRDQPGRAEMLAYDWSADGQYVAAVLPKAHRSAKDGTHQMSLIRVRDGVVRRLRDLSRDTRPQSIRFSPDGRLLAYDMPVTGERQAPDIFLLRLDNGAERPAVSHPAADRLLGWAPDGSGLLFISDRTGSPGAWFQSLHDGALHGGPRLVKENLPGDIQPLGFSRQGAYYFAASTDGQHEVYLASLDLERGLVTGSPMRVAQIPGSNEGPDWSPDGKALAYIHNGRRIVIHLLETGAERTLAPTTMPRIFTVASGDRYARWSPGGRTLLAPQNRIVFLVDVETGEASPILTDRRSRYGRWARDGKAIFYSRQLGLNDAPLEIVKVIVQTQEKEVLYRSELPGDNVGSLELSPDGLWLAFSDVTLDKTADDEASVLMLVPAAGGQPRLLLKVSGSEDVKVVGWTPDARDILFTRNRKLATTPSPILWRIGIDGGEPRSLQLGLPVLTSIRFHPDGRRVAFDSGQRGADIWVMENFLPTPEGAR